MQVRPAPAEMRPALEHRRSGHLQQVAPLRRGLCGEALVIGSGGHQQRPWATHRAQRSKCLATLQGRELFCMRSCISSLALQLLKKVDGKDGSESVADNTERHAAAAVMRQPAQALP